jgi:hypothetical protein
MKNVIYLILLFIGINGCFGQVTVDTLYTTAYMAKSTSFASTTFGVDLLQLSGASTTQNNATLNLPGKTMPRLNIGATHFWGYADLYVTFPLGLSLGKKADGLSSYKYSESVESGFKIYPYPMRPGRLTPYVGMSFQPISFQYSKSDTYQYGGAKYTQFISPVHVGLTYMTNKFMYNLGVRYNWRNKFEYYDSPSTITMAEINPVNINVSVFRYIDSDKSLSTEQAVSQLNIKHYLLDKNDKLNAWFWAVGPSAALQMSKSPYLKNKLPYMYNDMTNSLVFPEVTFGRYFYKNDFNVSASLRHITWTQKGFDTKLKHNRTSLAIEGYKFLFDYHGFVPFVGPSIMVDRLSVDVNKVNQANEIKPVLGIVFGWDIRVTNTGTSLLRTNLRWAPGNHLDIKGDKVMFDHLEFNFIQYVKFLGRNSVYKAHRT